MSTATVRTVLSTFDTGVRICLSEYKFKRLRSLRKTFRNFITLCILVQAGDTTIDQQFHRSASFELREDRDNMNCFMVYVS
jgi:hypothetical protein